MYKAILLAHETTLFSPPVNGEYSISQAAQLHLLFSKKMYGFEILVLTTPAS